MAEHVEVIDVVTTALYVLTGLPNHVRYIDPLVAGAHTPATNPVCATTDSRQPSDRQTRRPRAHRGHAHRDSVECRVGDDGATDPGSRGVDHRRGRQRERLGRRHPRPTAADHPESRRQGEGGRHRPCTGRHLCPDRQHHYHHLGHSVAADLPRLLPGRARRHRRRTAAGQPHTGRRQHPAGRARGRPPGGLLLEGLRSGDRQRPVRLLLRRLQQQRVLPPHHARQLRVRLPAPGRLRGQPDPEPGQLRQP